MIRMRRSSFAGAVLLGAALALTACASAPPRPSATEDAGGVASSQACAAATLTVTPSRGAPGSRFDVAGEGYMTCGDTVGTGGDAVTVVDVHWLSDGDIENLGEARIAEDGTLSGTFAVPDDAEPGTVELVAGDGLHVSSEPAVFTVE